MVFLFSGPIVEVVLRQGSAYGGGVLLEQDLQAAAEGGLHVAAGDGDDVALGNGLLGNGCLDDLVLAAQVSGGLYILIDPSGAVRVIRQEPLYSGRILLGKLAADQDAGSGCRR